jgi:hypothetical protein
MKSKFRQTVAGFLAAATMGTAPAQEVRAENTTPVQQEVSKVNKNAVVEEKQKKNQGIQINDTTGGLDFSFLRMGNQANPIYFPKNRTWASQRRAAQKRKRAK